MKYTLFFMILLAAASCRDATSGVVEPENRPVLPVAAPPMPKPGIIAPTPGGLADNATLAHVRAALGWPEERACSNTFSFLTALYAMGYEEGPAACGEGNAEHCILLGNTYNTDPHAFRNMGGWDVVWYHSARHFVPSYLVHCAPADDRKVVFGTTMITCTNNGTTCAQNADTELRSTFGARIYPDLLNPNAAADVLLAMGMKGRPRAGLERIRFKEYSETIQSVMTARTLDPGENLCEGIVLARQYLPFIAGSWDEEAAPTIKKYACARRLPRECRDAFLHTVHTRLDASDFWKDSEDAAQLPDTLDALCVDVSDEIGKVGVVFESCMETMHARFGGP